MKISCIRESSCIKANMLLNQSNGKKGYKSVITELNKVKLK